MHEKKMHQWNSFITLSYDDEFLPEHGNLEYRDFQLFLKRLRKAIAPEAIRFYMCGEYGELHQRPHYHALIFGYSFEDRKPWKKGSNGDTLYRSALLDRIWGMGHCLIGDVTYQSAAYVARYCMKKVTGLHADQHYGRVDPDTGEIYYLTPEFNQMSRRPGIGLPFIEKFHKDVYPSDEVIVRGKPARVPKYYDRWFKEQFPEEYEDLLLGRAEKAQALVGPPSRLEKLENGRLKAVPVPMHETSRERQEAKAEVAAARLAFKKRQDI